MRTLYPVGNAMVELDRHQITNSCRLRSLRSLRATRLAFATRDGNFERYEKSRGHRYRVSVIWTQSCWATFRNSFAALRIG